MKLTLARGFPRPPKASLFVFVAGLVALHVSALRAEDFSLKDGRVLKNAIIRTDEASSVVVLHEGGLSSVPKALLPEAIALKYPVDTKRMANDQALAAERRRLAREDQELRAAKRSFSDQNESAPEETEIATENEYSKCLKLVREYFRNHPGSYFDDGHSQVSVDYVRREPGLKDRWYLRASINTTRYEEDKYPFLTDLFAQEPRSTGSVPYPADGYPPTPLPTPPTTVTKVVREFHHFEGYVMLDAEPYVIDLEKL